MKRGIVAVALACAGLVLLVVALRGEDEPKVAATTTTRPRPAAAPPHDLSHSFVIDLPANGKRAPLLVLLHGLGGLPEDFGTLGLPEALRRLGPRAPDVLLVNGGYGWYHDREIGKWGSYVLDTAIPAAVRRLGSDPRRIAIGGISMGGFGALDLARLEPDRFCAVGGHSPSLFRNFVQSPPLAFDNAADFERNDLLGLAGTRVRPYGRARVWLDVGDRESLLPAVVQFARLLRAHGTPVQLHIWQGAHQAAYWRAHMEDYLRFYAGTLARCG